MRILLILTFVYNSQSFLMNGKLKQIVITRALQATLTEALAVNVFDVSAVVHELACDCNDHPYFPIYITGFLVSSYFYIVNRNYDKLNKVDFYLNVKKNMRFILMVMFLILGKNVENVI